MRTNPITLIDGYKIDHRRQYPPGTRYVYSNLTPRASRIEGQHSVVLLGLQYFLRRYLMEEMDAGFFGRGRVEVIERYRERLDGYLGANQIGLEHIEALHALGYVPLRFCALPEGTPVPLRVPMLTVENTHPDFAWLPNYIETILCNVLWLPCTSATTAWRYRQLLDHYAALTGGDPAFVDWQGHDFSFRGLAGVEAAQLSGMGHLASFLGTDTIPALDLIEHYYGWMGGEPLGGSVPATEHSVMCAGGHEDELGTFRRLLELYPSGVVSVVSDTWDLWHVLTSILPQLRDQIMARNGKLVIRPDSGDPVKILCGDPEAEPGTPAHQGVVSLLWQVFGGTATNGGAGHRQLDPHIGAIYGDSITYERARAICERLAANRFASTNVVLGIGSYCVAPETPVLCVDLVWRAAGSLAAGDAIIAFDEDPTFDDNRHAARRYRTATIVSNEPAVKHCSRVYTDIGDPITASDDHPWLVWAQNRSAGTVFYEGAPKSRAARRRVPRGPGLVWRRTSELQPGDLIAYLAKPWAIDESRAGGWLSGMFDGEGCISRSTGEDRIPAWKVNISQNAGPIMDRLRVELRNRGFDFYENKRKCGQLVLTGGWVEVLRFLGTIAPERLFNNKLPSILASMPALKRDATFKVATVTAVESVGNAPVASIQTSVGTFITGGYLSHNTYQYVTRDTYGFAMKATSVDVNGERRDLFKRPVTDSGVKFSATGRLAVVEGKGELTLIERATPEQEAASLLTPVWANGEFLREDHFNAIRRRLRDASGVAYAREVA